MIKKIQKKIKQIIKQYGWPDTKLVGVEGADGAWLLVQHAYPYDGIVFQKKCLVLMEQKAKEKLIPLRHLAYLKDRILVKEGKKQLFGTQFYLNKQEKIKVSAIRDKNKLAQRRKEYGLGSFEQYKKRIIKSQKKLDNLRD